MLSVLGCVSACLSVSDVFVSCVCVQRMQYVLAPESACAIKLNST